MSTAKVRRWAPAIWGGLLLLALVFAAGFAYSMKPVSIPGKEEITHAYKHNASFAYTVFSEPSILYPTGVIGPVGARKPALLVKGPDGSNSTVEAQVTLVKPPPIYTRLARKMAVDISYTLESNEPLTQATGEVTVSLKIQAGMRGEGWSISEPLQAAVRFEGHSTTAKVIVDFQRVFALISRIEEETGVRRAAGYDLAIVPTIFIKGKVGPEDFTDTFSPAFSVHLDNQEIRPDVEIFHSRWGGPVRLPKSAAQGVTFMGFFMPLETIQRVSGPGASLTLMAAIALAAAVFFGLGQRLEHDRILFRNRSRIVHVTEPPVDDRVIQVKSIHDLLRVARDDGVVYYYRNHKCLSHLFFVTDGLLRHDFVAES